MWAPGFQDKKRSVKHNDNVMIVLLLLLYKYISGTQLLMRWIHDCTSKEVLDFTAEKCEMRGNDIKSVDWERRWKAQHRI